MQIGSSLVEAEEEVSYSWHSSYVRACVHVRMRVQLDTSWSPVTAAFSGLIGGEMVTHIAFVIHHLDLPRLTELHHGPDGHIELLARLQVHPHIVPL